MANPTTYFGWVMPNSADLVTDLPADFNVFGQGVDTSMQYLLGGTTGQILSKTSGTNMAFTWINNDQGDITGVTAGTGISGGGTSGTVTVTNSMATEITAAGDIIVGTGSGTFDNLPIGTTAQVLTADTTVSPYKVKWATPATVSSGLTLISRQTFSNVANTSTTFDGVFTSTYKTYIVDFETIYGATNADDLLFQWRYAGPTTQTSHSGNCLEMNNTNATLTSFPTSGSTAAILSPTSGASNAPASFVMNVNLQSPYYANFNYSGVETYTGKGYFGWSNTTNARTYTGFILSSASSNITGTVAVYGLATS
jgi:hypothetical protein